MVRIESLAVIAFCTLMVFGFMKKSERGSVCEFVNGYKLAFIATIFFVQTIVVDGYRADLNIIILKATYFFIPALLLWATMLTERKILERALVIVIVAFVWVFIEFRFFRIFTVVFDKDLKYPDVSIFAGVIYTGIASIGVQKLIRLDTHITRRDVIAIVKYGAGLVAMLFTVASSMDFVVMPEVKRTVREYPWQLLIYFPALLMSIALIEEMFFRAIVQDLILKRVVLARLVRNKNVVPWIAIFMTSLFFGLTHINNGGRENFPHWDYVFLTSIAGLWFGKFYEKTKSVFGTAFLHAIIDFIYFAFFHKN